MTRIPTPLGTLASFCAELRFEDLPPALVARARTHLLDTLGAALAGTRSAEFALVRGTAAPAGPTRIWGTEQSTSPRDAALVNGVAAHAFELDDCGGCDHSGAVVVPALLSAAAMAPGPVSGRDLVAALVVGYEVGRRVLEAAGGYEAHNGRGWHSTGTCGAVAAAAAAARLLDLPTEGMRDAITLSTSLSSGLWAFIHDGAQTKKLHAGRAAEGGLLAAQLAAGGMRGPTHAFDDVWGGFFRTFDGRQGDLTRLDADLGTVWKLDRVSLKPYASCRGAHSSIDALADVLAQTGRSSSDVAHIEIRLSTMLMGMCGSKETDPLPAAQMSLPYAVAAFLVHGEAGLAAYGSERRSDPRMATTMERVRLEPDPALDPGGEPEVRVVFDDGSEAMRTVPRATGSPERPMSPEAVLAKFRELSAMALPSGGSETLREIVTRIDRVGDVAVLEKALAGASDGQARLA